MTKHYKNKITIKYNDKPPLNLSLGSTYLILPGYQHTLYDYELFNDQIPEDQENNDKFTKLDQYDILIAMVTAITPSNFVWFQAICLQRNDLFSIAKYADNRLLLNVSNDQIEVKTHELLYLIGRIPRRCSMFSLYTAGYEIPISIVNIEYSMDGLFQTNIMNTGHQLRDLRNWSICSLHMWAEKHLGLSYEQLQTMREMQQKWKKISYAQEVFTHQCAMFNKKAAKVVNKKIDEADVIISPNEKIDVPLIKYKINKKYIKAEYLNRSNKSKRLELNTMYAYINDETQKPIDEHE